VCVCVVVVCVCVVVCVSHLFPVFFLQWRTIYCVLLPYLLLDAFTTRNTKRRDANGVLRVKHGVPVEPETKRDLQQLCVLLAGATSLIFVRTNFVSTSFMIQKLLLNYNILFAKLFPTNVVCVGFFLSLQVLLYFAVCHFFIIYYRYCQVPNQHISLHTYGAIICHMFVF